MHGAIYPLLYGAILVAAWFLASRYGPSPLKRALPWLAAFLGRAWFLVAGGGGLGILLIRGPWPPTNGWFALLSGLAACPLLGRFLRQRTGIEAMGWLQLSAAVLLITIGRLALIIWPQPNPL